MPTLINCIAIFFFGFCLSFIIVFISRSVALNKNWLLSNGVPLVGGIAIAFTFLILSLLSFSILNGATKVINGIIIASFLMFLFGLFDDFKELSVKAKVIVQIVAVFLLILCGVKSRIVYIGSHLNALITFVWVIAIINSFNLLDVMDGVAGVIALIVSIAFFVISLLNNDIIACVLSLILMSVLCGFLMFNFPPAKIYMGNSGSHFIGFLLASVALLLSYAPFERKVALLSPIIILGFPIFDSLFLVSMRIKRKRMIFKKSEDHLVLRFLKLGYTKKRTLFVMFSLSIFYSICGILLSQVSNFFAIITTIFVILISLLIAFRMSKVSVHD